MLKSFPNSGILPYIVVIVFIFIFSRFLILLFYFRRVADVHIPFDKVAKKFHDYGFVRFYKESDMKSALDVGSIKIGGEDVIIGNARPSRYINGVESKPESNNLALSIASSGYSSNKSSRQTSPTFRSKVPWASFLKARDNSPFEQKLNWRLEETSNSSFLDLSKVDTKSLEEPLVKVASPVNFISNLDNDSVLPKPSLPKLPLTEIAPDFVQTTVTKSNSKKLSSVAAVNLFLIFLVCVLLFALVQKLKQFGVFIV